MTEQAYEAQKTSRSIFLQIRNIRYHVRCWGNDSRPILVLLHGARDTSATFQFLVDMLRKDWCVFAPDWRGHGHTGWAQQSYWFHAFVADLDALLDALVPSAPANLVGHSLGGNAAGIFAALRPERVRRLVSLEGLGPLTTGLPVHMPDLLKTLLAQRHPRPSVPGYGSISEMAERLCRSNRRLDLAKALFLAQHSSVRAGDGRIRWLFDPTFLRSLPSLHGIEEWGACWRHVTAPTLWIGCSDLRAGAPAAVPGEIARRLSYLRDVRFECVPASGHNLHHDAPAMVASLTEAFLG